MRPPCSVCGAPSSARLRLFGREVYLCPMHLEASREAAKGAFTGAAKGLAQIVESRAPGVLALVQRAMDYRRQLQPAPPPAEDNEPIYVEAKVIR